MKKIDKNIKSYFQNEVEKCHVPPMPVIAPPAPKEYRGWSGIVLAAAIAASLLIIYSPRLQHNSLQISKHYQLEVIQEDLTSIILETSAYIKTKQGVYP